ncbi:GNAT family N-acetyltransferase [Jiangella asiatica]|uniref:N-acetyltransferase n=1 Tax=Jiangella asiatica TaxID=2530372 RepID=A0A4V2Z2T3_9ACTN|nr:GNAT family N-acetyltransferase [Jiangella asiatica]TDE10088.1 N-acetyltransferase [Jiangella asiatica]
MSIEITRTARSYAAYLDGTRVGELTYARRGDQIVALHTEVDPAAEGKGIGGALARALLDDARQSGSSVVPQCPFVASYLDRHPEYGDLVAS